VAKRIFSMELVFSQFFRWKCKSK